MLTGSAHAQPATTGAAPDSLTPPAHRWFPLPFLFYQPETKLGGGAALLHTWRSDAGARTSSDALAVVLTQREQYSLGLSTERYLDRDRWRLGGQLGWSRFPDVFYGVGNHTDVDGDEDFTPRSVGAGAAVLRAIRPSLYAGGTATFSDTKVVARETGGRLDNRDVIGHDGGRLAAVGVTVVWDDRDSVYGPTRGAFVSASLERFDAALGSEFEFWRSGVDARCYVPVASGHVVAAQAGGIVSSGSPPFYDLAKLGGASVLRGIYEGRYRDRDGVAVQIEHRFPIWKRLSGAAFVGTGQVAHDLQDLRLDAFHVAGGVGPRFLVSRDDRVVLRVDLGWAKDQSGVYFAFGDAF